MEKVNLTLLGLDGNAFAILAAFRKQAKREGWSEEEIDGVMTKAQLGDYDHLLRTIQDNCVNSGFGTEE